MQTSTISFCNCTIPLNNHVLLIQEYRKACFYMPDLTNFSILRTHGGWLITLCSSQNVQAQHDTKGWLSSLEPTSSLHDMHCRCMHTQRTLLQNRYFIPVTNYLLSRFSTRDCPSGTNIDILLSRQLFNRDKCHFPRIKKNRIPSSCFRVCKLVLQIQRFIKNCNLKIKI